MKSVLFGKLPAHGDFVSRGLVAGERDALDAWLTASLNDARAALGELFEDRYDRAPAWRFVEEEARRRSAGAIAPSVDSAGRRYPIYLAFMIDAGTSALAAAERCEDLLYRAFAENWDADRLHAETELSKPTGEAEAMHTACCWTLGGPDFGPAQLNGSRPRTLFREALTIDEAKI